MPGIASMSNARGAPWTSPKLAFTWFLPCSLFCLEVAKQCQARLGPDITQRKLKTRLSPQFPPRHTLCLGNCQSLGPFLFTTLFGTQAIHARQVVVGSGRSAAARRGSAGRTPVGTMLNTCTVQVDSTCCPPPPVLLPCVAGVDALCPDGASFPRHNKPPRGRDPDALAHFLAARRRSLCLALLRVF